MGALGQGAGKVLDIGSGAGRHAVALPDRGLDVTALDDSPGAAEVCRGRGVERVAEATPAQFTATGERFDTPVMLGLMLGCWRA
jgi:methylase of polypeptide subunit release factors